MQISFSLLCYDCFDTGPSNKNCIEAKNCTGSACLLYEGGDNKTSTAFCLLGSEYKDTTKLSTGCWLEADGLGKHCLCLTNFCNKLRDRTHVVTYDPFASPLPDLAFLKHNPFIDYEYIEDEKNVGPNSKPAPSNVLFPSAAEVDLSVSGDSDNNDFKEDDLVPVDFEEYKEWEEKEKQKTITKTVPDRSKEVKVFPEVPHEEEQEVGIANIIARPEVEIIDKEIEEKETKERNKNKETFNGTFMLFPGFIIMILSIGLSLWIR
uniref:Uncharacterized protein n=1 Tax=Acrobeloides nanus TaxID=290746 RepID=A0A914D8P8_9BILA